MNIIHSCSDRICQYNIQTVLDSKILSVSFDTICIKFRIDIFVFEHVNMNFDFTVYRFCLRMKINNVDISIH